MKHISLLSDPSDQRLLLHDFDEEMAEIERFHRYVIQASQRDFDAACDEVSRQLDPELHDEGDVVGFAEEQLGVTPWIVASHSGLMAVSRHGACGGDPRADGSALYPGAESVGLSAGPTVVAPA